LKNEKVLVVVLWKSDNKNPNNNKNNVDSHWGPVPGSKKCWPVRDKFTNDGKGREESWKV